MQLPEPDVPFPIDRRQHSLGSAMTHGGSWQGMRSGDPGESVTRGEAGAIDPEFRVRPDLKPLEGPTFTIDRSFPLYLETKLSLRGNPWCSVRSKDVDVHAAEASLAHLRDLLHSHHPEWPLFEGARDTGEQLALSVPEDLVLMNGTVAEAMWVCLPTRWDPLDKIGKDFAEIHAPVPFSKRLLSAQRNVAKAMSQKGPFVRFVWTLTFDRSLSAHPSMPRCENGETVYFRVERQVTLPMRHLDRSWFLIRVYVAPLEHVLTSQARLESLERALLAMPDELVSYKQLHRVIPRAREVMKSLKSRVAV